MLWTEDSISPLTFSRQLLCGATLQGGHTWLLLLGQTALHLQLVPDMQPLPVGQADLVMQPFTVGALEPVII